MGYSFLKLLKSDGNTLAAAGDNIFTSPEFSKEVSCNSFFELSTKSKMLSTLFRNNLPYSFKTIYLPFLSNNWTPSSFSKEDIVLLKAGCAIFNLCDAFVMCSILATVWKYLRCNKSIV